MKLATALAVAGLIGSGPALAQTASVTTGPDGQLTGSVSAPGLPQTTVQAGNGAASSSAGAVAGGGQAQTYSSGPGRSVTVRSPDGRSSSSVSVTGDNAVVAGAGSPGSRIVTDSSRASDARICPRGASRAYRLRTHCRIAHR